MGANTSFNRFMRIRAKLETIMFEWKHRMGTQKEYLEERSKLMESPDYQKLTQAQREYFRGMCHMFFEMVERNDLVFTYIVDGKRMICRSPEYDATVNYQTLDTNTGSAAWAKDITRLF